MNKVRKYYFLIQELDEEGKYPRGDPTVIVSVDRFVGWSYWGKNFSRNKKRVLEAATRAGYSVNNWTSVQPISYKDILRGRRRAEHLTKVYSLR